MSEQAPTWSDLDAFTQGYVEALFASEQAELWEDAGYKPASRDDPRVNEQWGFPDLAPETLARIIEDCAQFVAAHAAEGFADEQAGRDFWAARPDGWHDAIGAIPGFPPLTAHLGDDGKVYLRESTQ